MDSLLTYYPINESIFQSDSVVNFRHYCIFVASLCLLMTYRGYTRVLWKFLEKTTIPKLYQKTIVHSVWMGSIHLVLSILCFSQLWTVVYPRPSADSSWFLNNILYAATVNFCPLKAEQNGNSSNPSEDPIQLVSQEIPGWTVCNAISTIIISAALIQEILIATRNKMDQIFYSRLLGIIFVTTAAKTGCPILSIQGIFLMSLNSSSKHIAHALVAWKSYCQDDSDHRPSPVVKTITFIFFVLHILIWCTLLLFHMPLFVHQLPPVTKSDPNRFFLAYACMSFLGYIVLEIACSPLWTTLRCMGWCRRASGVWWRILAVSDCHLLGHYSNLQSELFYLQGILDEKRALVRNKRVQKKMASIDEQRKRRSDLPTRRSQSPSLLATSRTLVALKKKVQRRMEEVAARTVTTEDTFQLLPEEQDSLIDIGRFLMEEEAISSVSEQDSDTSKHSEELPEISDAEEIPGSSDEGIEECTIEEAEVTFEHYTDSTWMED